MSSKTRTEIVYNPDPDIDVEYDQNLESNEYIAHDHNYVKPKLLEITMSSETGTEILYNPNPDIDFLKFKQEPIDIGDIMSSDSDSLVNENFICDQTRTNCP